MAIERAHHLAEVAHARQDDLGCAPQPRRTVDQRVRRADLGERVLDRAQIAGAVVEDGDHSSPLVDGNWPRSRLSCEQAYFRARAQST